MADERPAIPALCVRPRCTTSACGAATKNVMAWNTSNAKLTMLTRIIHGEADQAMNCCVRGRAVDHGLSQQQQVDGKPANEQARALAQDEREIRPASRATSRCDMGWRSQRGW